MVYHNILTKDELLALLSPEELETYNSSKEREELEADPALNLMQMMNTVSELQVVVARLSMRVKHLERQLQFQKQELTLPQEASLPTPSTVEAPISPKEGKSLISRAERHRTHGSSFFKK